jgi:hypothetical protein
LSTKWQQKIKQKVAKLLHQERAYTTSIKEIVSRDDQFCLKVLEFQTVPVPTL